MSNSTDYPAGSQTPGDTMETMAAPLLPRRVVINTVLLMEVSSQPAQTTSIEIQFSWGHNRLWYRFHNAQGILHQERKSSW